MMRKILIMILALAVVAGAVYWGVRWLRSRANTAPQVGEGGQSVPVPRELIEPTSVQRQIPHNPQSSIESVQRTLKTIEDINRMNRQNQQLQQQQQQQNR